MHALFITVQFAEVLPSTRRAVADIGRRLRRVEGLTSTTWMTSGSNYALWQLFESQGAAERYLDSTVLEDLARLPGCEDVYVQRFDVAEGLTQFSAPAAHVDDAIEDALVGV